VTNKEIIALTTESVAGTYRRFPIALVRGEGTRVWDADGKEYLDFVAGIAVCNLGHCHPKVVGAIKEQAEKLIHVSNLYHIAPQAEFARLLCEHSFADKVFFANSGAEANEAAIKLARKYFHSRGEDRFQVISMERSFHGRTMAAMAATGQKKVQEGFEPLLEKFSYVPFNDLRALEAALSEKTAAVMAEPIQGERGVYPPSEGYLKGMKALCEEAGALLIFDEVQVGMGRTGTLFAYEQYDVTPDIMTLAKGLAGGVAMGAMLANDEVAAAFTPGSHASTFGGNPLASAAGMAAVKAIIDEGLLDNCRTVGAYLAKKLDDLKRSIPAISEIRGKGLIVGMDIDVPCGAIVTKCMEKGLLINCTGESTLRFIPPLTVTEADVDRMIALLEGVIREEVV